MGKDYSNLKEQLLAILSDGSLPYSEKRKILFDACERITSLEHDNENLKNCIDGIVFSYKFMMSFGENENFLQDGFKQRLFIAKCLIEGNPHCLIDTPT